MFESRHWLAHPAHLDTHQWLTTVQAPTATHGPRPSTSILSIPPSPLSIRLLRCLASSSFFNTHSPAPAAYSNISRAATAPFITIIVVAPHRSHRGRWNPLAARLTKRPLLSPPHLLLFLPSPFALTQHSQCTASSAFRALLLLPRHRLPSRPSRCEATSSSSTNNYSSPPSRSKQTATSSNGISSHAFPRRRL